MTDTPTSRRNYRHKTAWRTTIRQQVLATTGGRCRLCGWPGTDGQGKGLALAHLIPHDAGGPDEPHNLTPLCPTCHTRFDAGRRRPNR